MKIEVSCQDCHSIRLVNTNGMLRKSYECKYPVCRSCGAKRVVDKISKGWFKKGESTWNKGTHITSNTGRTHFKKGEHVSTKTEFKSGQKPWNSGLPYLVDDKHPSWAGDNVGYNALHSWIYRKLGKPNFCARCKTTESKRFMWHNISRKYKRDLHDWERLCATCHANEHKNWEAKWHVV